MVLIDPTSAAAKYHSEDKSYYSATVRKWSGNRYRLGILQPNGTDRLIALIDSYPFITPCGWRNSWDMRCKCYIVYLFCIAVYSACICKDDVDNMDWFLTQQDIHVGYEWYINNACISVIILMTHVYLATVPVAIVNKNKWDFWALFSVQQFLRG